MGVLEGTEGVLDTERIWLEAFGSTVTDELQNSGIPSDEWRRGGRTSKDRPNKEDGSWWSENGRDMFLSFAEWWEKNKDWMVWRTPEGELAVELKLEYTFGEVPVLGYADFLAYDPDGILSVVDLKTGAGMPETSMQLGMYAVMVYNIYGVYPQRGYYFDARKCIMVPAEGMELWTHGVLTEMFSQFKLALDNNIFLPSPGFGCSTCGVKQFCHVKAGWRAPEFDPLASL